MRLERNVRDLLANRIDSFEKLELVIALHTAPRATMSIDALSRVLLLSRDTIRDITVELHAVSLVELTSVGEARLLPPTDADRIAVDALVRQYREDRIVIVKTLGEIALRRIRDMASRTFTDRKKPREQDG